MNDLISAIQSQIDNLPRDRFSADFLRTFPNQLTAYILLADALARMTRNTFPEESLSSPEEWAPKFLHWLEGQGDRESLIKAGELFAVPILPAGAQPIAGLTPGKEVGVTYENILKAIGIVVRLPISFVEECGKIVRWKVGTNHYRVIDGKTLADWLRVANYVRPAAIANPHFEQQSHSNPANKQANSSPFNSRPQRPHHYDIVRV